MNPSLPQIFLVLRKLTSFFSAEPCVELSCGGREWEVPVQLFGENNPCQSTFATGLLVPGRAPGSGPPGVIPLGGCTARE